MRGSAIPDFALVSKRKRLRCSKNQSRQDAGSLPRTSRALRTPVVQCGILFGLEKFALSAEIRLSLIMMSPTRTDEAAPDPAFYERLRQHLAASDFDHHVFALCEQLYWTTYLDTNVRIDPAVYFKMLMVGFLENLSSERAIAARCSDSLSVRALLGYGSSEDLPGKHELSAIGNRLAPRLYEEVLDIIVLALKSHGLLNGETIGSELIEENANLRGLINRNTEYVCRSYFNESTRQPHVLPPKIHAAEPGLTTGPVQSAFAAPRQTTCHETGDDAHQARWCRRIAGRRRVQLKKASFRWLG